MQEKKSKAGKRKSNWKFIFLIFLMLFATVVYYFVFFPNINVRDQKPYLYVSTGSSFNKLMTDLAQQQILKNPYTFKILAHAIDLPTHIHPGKYKLEPGMSNKDLLLKLRYGKQNTVKLVLNNIRTREDLIAKVSEQLETNADTLRSLLNDSIYLSRWHLNPQNVMCMMIPNTYDMYWNTSSRQFLDRMSKEYKKFWNQGRLAQCEKIQFSPLEVSIIASIVEKESIKSDEKPVIAGVYINRLHRNMKLEADPTLVFAFGDFGIKRVLNIHKAIDSPYNTYMYTGLPPGPICMPSIASIQAVLNYQAHDYLFFCAKEDFSGYHNFAANYAEQQINAQKYRKALDNRNIKN